MTASKSNTHFDSYRDILNAFESELPVIAQIKRFMECYSGDGEFRKKIDRNHNDSGLQEYLRNIGVEIEPNDLSILWSKSGKIGSLITKIVDPSAAPLQESDIDNLNLSLDKYPLVKLWVEWIKANRVLIKRRNIPEVTKNPRFKAWQRRRVNSAKGELGFFAESIDHPLFAFELSKGCSVGCWFCGFSAKKLSAVFEYTPQNRTLWRKIVKTGVDLFGRGTSSALCYWATEPVDNPNYLDFMKDYKEIAGAALCTATAAPLRNPHWFRSLVSFYKGIPLPWPRISVLSLSMLRGIHKTYTPDELRDCGLLMQMKDSARLKAKSGRIVDNEEASLSGFELPDDAPYIPQGSIACVTGFLVNMIDHTIKMISPCYASKQWPYGYRVFAETTFEGADGYRAALERIVEKDIMESANTDRALSFRDDLRFTPADDGFTLVSPNSKHNMRGRGYHKRLGELVSRGDKTYGELFDILTAEGAPPFELTGTITKLFDRGLLDETAHQ